MLGPEDSEVDLICILMNMVCGEVKRGAFGPRVKDADLLIYDLGSIAQKPSRRHFWWRSSTSKTQGRDPFSRSELRVGQKDLLEGTSSGLKEKWDCSQAEDD